ncbi:hypothetical protein BWQ96_09649 [Gracilariopsis chorda]|uniref:Uncharacterized protein n=1 Tax=Gracilariopsis chorda TaxID=448386 RepID=A0A2V3IEX5_9FLOR|nr:hypothetical protein BWQ96_09648 [Gracilariopsis chorda]PXF40636.1 hypothetical protein BWQ96_09649 [Gracilariopsis chorda]|eukprot:PXF40635.1 hypothetical protein BWQ96_09648 [Gracilariopsis chorda]
MELAALSDVFYIVVLAYIAAFMPWTAFSAKDFISDKWKSTRHTRQAGYINLLFAIVPACYIVLYCRVQFFALDWKEGCAAVAALAFALLHGFRLGWGLWQLYLFRSSCADSIEALEAMGVTYRYCDENRRDVVDKHCKSAWEKADEMLVNNRVVDNQF